MNEAPATVQARPELPTFGRDHLTPGTYYLDLEAVMAFPLTVNGQSSTFLEAYRKLLHDEVLKVPDSFASHEEVYKTNAGEVTVTGDSSQSYVSGQVFVLQLLRNLIDLHAQGIDPQRATWFYYGHDWSRDADELFEFFLVHDGKIVSERFAFGNFDPRVLKKCEVGEPIWHSEPYGQMAWEKYWYRKFYTDTLTGQLMVLRPDEPVLYHYSRPAANLGQDAKFITLLKIYKLLWVAVPLIAAIAFPVLRLYMAVTAGVCVADLVWTSWAMRKVGQ